MISRLVPRTLLAAVLLSVVLVRPARGADHSDVVVYATFHDAGGDVIEGPVQLAALRGSIEALGLLDRWSAPFDEATGQVEGPARHDVLQVTIPMHALAIRVVRELRRQLALDRVVFHVLRREGIFQEEFYRIAFESVHVAGFRLATAPSAASDRGSEHGGLLAELDLVYDTTAHDAFGRVARLLYLRGDVNNDRAVDISDTIKFLGFLFLGDGIFCPLAGDTNNDLKLDVSDAIFALSFLFNDGPRIPSPYPSCGELPLDQVLPCNATACEIGG